MARINKYTSSQTYALLREEAKGKFSENNDCAVTALAILCDVPYEQAHALCKKHGRKDRDGTYFGQLFMAFQSAGHTLRAVPARTFIDQYPKAHHVLKSVTTHHPERFNNVWADGKRYLLHATWHFAAVVNGKTEDWSAGHAKRVVAICEVVKK